MALRLYRRVLDAHPGTLLRFQSKNVGFFWSGCAHVLVSVWVKVMSQHCARSRPLCSAWSRPTRSRSVSLPFYLSR
eukprot:2564470-Rhodomonas_salina.2